ncbi:glycosyltransferase family 4 protein [Anaeromyxobacter paludicola]|uniref:GDP-mannose-dependent alpha-(1-2)-phosphatidylinositol mannosyltransferase n=1 Tax=Anaeromyxobacter paludicola TaxID=2918171 RepID=A0ABM7X5X6_9BACT|nr:glycosyltransferase family 4 protein [Anaeromyxobacter paludicola]BDG07220.1 GDP-mannose-dependent alpha-(1-2)-phosphatidylinositol mannosyltransferase [Anaeromyxobacter paludicola]
MRIGIVTEHYGPGSSGVVDHVRHFAREARRLGHAVKIVTGGAPAGCAPEDGPEVIRLGSSRPLLHGGALTRVSTGLGTSRAMREVLARERFDVVHVHCPLTPVLPLLALHHATGPVVGTFHGQFRPWLPLRLGRGVLQRYLDRLDAAVAVSRACLTALRGRLRADFAIIPNGVDLERFARGRRLRRYDDGRVNVLFAGRPEPRGGLDRMIAAFLVLRAQLDCRLLVLGEGPLLPRYKALVPVEAREEVVFAGEVGDARPDWFATADVVCAPTRSATFGMPLLEAMAAGKPVIASDVDGHREVLRQGREGELVDPDDERAWARAILRATREPARGAALGERGRQTAQRYAWPVVAREVLALYRSIGVRG